MITLLNVDKEPASINQLEKDSWSQLSCTRINYL